MNCFCHFCGSSLLFHICRAGELVNCFNCGMETVLFIPGLQAPYSPEQYVLETKEIRWTNNPFGFRYLEGIVENKSLKHLDWVRVEFILYRQPTLPVGSTSDSICSFAPGKLWKFRAPVSQSEAVEASSPLLSCEYGRVVSRTDRLVKGPVRTV